MHPALRAARKSKQPFKDFLMKKPIIELQNVKREFVVGEEKYRGLVNFQNRDQFLSWLQISYTRRDNFNLSDKFTLGTYAQLFYSTRRLSKTYQATMMQAAAFTPTQNSIFTYDPKFRANQFVAGGVIPIFKVNNFLQVRPGFYAFAPYRKIYEKSDGTAFYKKERFIRERKRKRRYAPSAHRYGLRAKCWE